MERSAAIELLEQLERRQDGIEPLNGASVNLLNGAQRLTGLNYFNAVFQVLKTLNLSTVEFLNGAVAIFISPESVIELLNP